MFAIIKNNAFERFLPEGTAFEIDGVQYPANWLNLSTPEEKAAVGVVDVVYAERPDDKYYWVSEAAPVYANGVVTVSFTATPKDFAQCQQNAITSVKQTAFSILAPTDYIDTRNLRDPSYKVEWMAWRESILETCRAYVAQIEACTTVQELANLPQIEWAKDPSETSI